MGPDAQRQEQQWALVELERRLSNLVRVGVVHEADYDQERLRVRYDETPDGTPVVTTWLPWAAQRAGPDGEWWAPEQGEQVVLLSPSGDLGQALVLASLTQMTFPPLEKVPTRHTRRYADGATIVYDREAHRLEATLPDEGSVSIRGGRTVSVQAGRINLN